MVWRLFRTQGACPVVTPTPHIKVSIPSLTLQLRASASTAVVGCEVSCGSFVSRRRRHSPTLLTSNVAVGRHCICWRAQSRMSACESLQTAARLGGRGSFAMWCRDSLRAGHAVTRAAGPVLHLAPLHCPAGGRPPWLRKGRQLALACRQLDSPSLDGWRVDGRRREERTSPGGPTRAYCRRTAEAWRAEDGLPPSVLLFFCVHYFFGTPVLGWLSQSMAARKCWFDT